MKIVVTYSIGDGCTWSADSVIPVEYESEEALLVDLEEAANAYLSKKPMDRDSETKLSGTNIFIDHLIENGKYYAPSIRTLEQWFADESKE